jgi:long-chain acyl-CoA synthetase
MATIRTYLTDANEKGGNRTFVRWKSHGEWHSWTFSELYQRSRIVSEAANKLEIRPGFRAALMMENRPEWLVTYLGLAAIGIEVVPIDARLQEKEVSYILRDSGTYAIFASGKLWPLLNHIAETLPDLKHIVALDGAIVEKVDLSYAKAHDYVSLMDSVQEAAAQPDAYFDNNIPVESDIASIIYTSGTTGYPKGAMISHGNFTTQLFGALQYFHVYEHDNFLLVLPLHHGFAFSANFLVPLCCRCEISMVENLRTVAENMKEVSPTMLLAVPLLAEKMYNGIMAKLKKNFAAKLLLKLGLGKVIGKKVKEGLGGKLRLIICGGAATDVAVMKGYTKLGIGIMEGYGLTETSPICALTPEHDIRFGSVGKVIPNCEGRIANPNEDGIGEIQIKGPIVMQGYFNNEAATAACMDGDWFMTGDLGKMDKDGYITITGRKKCMIVNREGKNIYPEEVEGVIASSPWILESLVLGYSEEGEKGERVGAIVVPNLDYFAEHKENGRAYTEEEINDKCRDEVQRVIKEISDYKHPRKIIIRMEPFEKTTTLKVKRFLYKI